MATKKELEEKILENNIVQKLEALRVKLICTPELSELIFSQPDISNPQDPSIFITNADLHVNIQIKMQLTGKNVILNLVPKENRVKEKKEFIKSIDKNKLKLPYEPAETHTYAPAFDQHTKVGDNRNIPHLNNAEVTKRILDTLSRLKDLI